MMAALSPKQGDLLRFIAGHQAAKGFCPSFREMGAALGVTSTQSIARLLDELEQRGAIRRLCQRARSVEVLVPVAIPLAPDGAPLRSVPIGDYAWA